VCDFVRFVLDSYGYDVACARDGEEAIRVLDREKAHVDLLVSDVVMPRMNGRELASELMRRRPELRVLHISGYPGDMVSRFGETDHEFAFLAKPFTCDALAQKVREVLDGGPPARRRPS
jgi:DNA-binding NtrC family response regulator